MLFKSRLFTSLSILAVLANGMALAASPIDQSSINHGDVLNSSPVPSEVSPMIGNSGDPINLGVSSSISVSATGSVAAVSVSGVDAYLPTPSGGLGGVWQSSVNNGAITNAIPGVSYDVLSIDVGGGALSTGASLSVSATGAVAAVSISSVNGGSDTLPMIGAAADQSHINDLSQNASYNINSVNSGVRQTGTDFVYYEGLPDLSPGVVNNGAVINYGAINNINSLDVGASVSVSASGAVGVVTISGVNTNFSGSVIGNIAQSVSNTGEITNDGAITFSGVAPSIGTGSSVAVSVSGAVSSTGISLVDSSMSGLNLGYVQQQSLNSSSGVLSNSGTINLGGATLANGASASVSATGAVAAVSVSGTSSAAGDNTFGAPPIGASYQDTGNGNNGVTVYSGSNSPSHQGIALSGGDPNQSNSPTTPPRTPFTFVQNWQYGIVQSVINSGAVTNTGNISDAGALATGASVSVSATGAVASYSVSGNNTNVTAPEATSVDLGITGGGYYTGPINGVMQSVTNESGAPISNTGTITNVASLGNGASVSISATGAVASVSGSSVTSSESTSVFTMPSISGASDTTITYTDPYNTGATNYNETSTLTGSGGTGPTAYATYNQSYSHTTQLGTHTDGLMGIGQSAQNYSTVDNTATMTGIGALGTGSSVSASATGAVASVSLSGVNSTFNSGSISLINQYAYNRGTITNSGSLTGDMASLGTGASMSVSATGAVASISVSGVSDSADSSTTLTLPNIGIDNSWAEYYYWDSYNTVRTGSGSGSSNNGTYAGFSGDYTYYGIVQNAQNRSGINNSGSISGLTTLGVGASASMSVSGAVSAISFAGNNVTMDGTVINKINQYSYNAANMLNSGSITAGSLDEAASVSISASGAVASVGVSVINSSLSGLLFFSFDDAPIIQSSSNYNEFSNQGTISLANGSGDLGRGASVSVSATGAVTSVSISSVSSDSQTIHFPSFDNTNSYGTAITQTSINAGDTTNTGVIQNVGDLGAGASVSVGSTGAVASVAYSANNMIVFPSAMDRLEQSTNNSGNISTAGVSSISAGSLGNGASASISATGSVTSFSINLLESSYAAGSDNFVVGRYGLSQTAFSMRSIYNDSEHSISVGELSGVGSSVSISASGAVASVSYSNILGSGEYMPGAPALQFDGITQYATNASFIVDAPVTNGGTIQIGGSGMVGVASSASVSATGAVASVSYTTVQNTTTGTPSVAFGDIHQTVLNGDGNLAPIINNGVIIISGGMGKGASASVSATGAVASIQVASIVDTTVFATTSLGSASQQVTNVGSVSNRGSIAFMGGGPVGLAAGASASISATGAVASVSFRAIR